MIKRFLATFFSICMCGLSIAILIKAGIGLSPYDALSQTLSNISRIRVGDITIILNSFLFIFQLILLKKEFPKTQILQIILIFSLGYIINIFYYSILIFEVHAYIQRILLFIVGITISSFSVALIMNVNFVFTALEGFLKALAMKLNGDFVIFRWGFDIFAIVMSILLAIIFKSEILIREGTVFSFILFSPLMGYFMKLQRPILIRMGLLEIESK